MATPFAAIEARTARAVLRHAANAQATATIRFGEQIQFPVIFDNGYQAMGALPEMAAAQPSAMALQSDLMEVPVGTRLEINDARYTVAEIQPDGTGMAIVLLELAA